MSDNKDNDKFDDDSIMPFGKHKGKPMSEVPSDYLDWLHGQEWVSEWPKVLGYIEDNMDLIDLALELEDD